FRSHSGLKYVFSSEYKLYIINQQWKALGGESFLLGGDRPDVVLSFFGPYFPSLQKSISAMCL
ncbi:MAG: hypothetical protein ABJZ92_01155, partial [Cyclobacteriaceae bacterium]